MSSRGKMVVFKGAKIDGRRVKRVREPETGRVSAVNGFLSGPIEGTPEEAASRFLDANHRLFKSKRSIIRELQVEKVSRSPAGYHVVFQQLHQGLPVEEAKVSVHMTADKRVHAAHVGLRPKVAGLDVRQMTENGIDQDEAIRIALAAVGAADQLMGPAQAKQVILAEESPRLAWKVSFATERPAGEWLVWVDALSGNVLRRREISMD